MARTPLFAALAGVLSVASYSPTEALPGQPPFDGKYLAVVNGQWLAAPGAVVPPMVSTPAAMRPRCRRRSLHPSAADRAGPGPGRTGLPALAASGSQRAASSTQ